MTRIGTLLATALTLNILVPKAGLASDLSNVTITSTKTTSGGAVVLQLSGSRSLPTGTCAGTGTGQQYTILSAQKTTIAQALLAQTSGASVDITGANSCDSSTPPLEILSTLTMRPPPAPTWSLANKPAVPDPRDDEFDGPTPWAGWTNNILRDDVRPIDPYASFDGTNGWRYSWNSMRAGWALVQATNNQANSGVNKSITWATDDLVYIRLFSNSSGNGPDDGEVTIHLANATYYLGMSLNNAGVSNDPRIHCYWPGGQSNDGIGAAITGWNNLVEYMMIHRTGGKYHFFIANSNGSWFPIISAVDAGWGAMTTVMLRFYNSVPNNGLHSTGGNTVVGLDFIRFRQTATNLP
jgi:hypothetical protein